MLTKNSKTKPTSNHPLTSFMERYQFDNEREGIERAIFTLSRLAMSASFAPMTDPEMHYDMMEVTRDIFDSMVEYHGTL